MARTVELADGRTLAVRETGDPGRCLIVEGGDDRFVPRSHGAWLEAHVPGCEAWLGDHVHEWLLRAA